MTTRPADQFLGAYLTDLRTNAGLDVVVLARRVSLSVAQVLELEEGHDSLFYNRRIRLQAARKIILTLGGDPAQLPVDSTAAALQDQVLVAADPVPRKMAMSKPAASVAPMASLVVPGRMPRVRGGVAVVVGSSLLVAFVWVGTYAGAPARSLQATDVALAMVPVSVPVSAPAPLQPEQALPERVAAQAEPMEVAAIVELPKQEGDKVGANVASQPLGEEASACAWWPGEVPVYQPPQARKPGDMVYVVSLVSQVLCVADASGKPKLQRLEAGQSQSFYGQPPWQVASSQLQQTQLYFQGSKVRLPAQAQDRIQLVELR